MRKYTTILAIQSQINRASTSKIQISSLLHLICLFIIDENFSFFKGGITQLGGGLSGWPIFIYNAIDVTKKYQLYYMSHPDIRSLISIN